MNCGKCKFWSGYKNGLTGVCDFADSLSYDFRMHKDEELKNTNSMGVYADASDDSGLRAELRTGVNFGCIGFIAKFDPELFPDK